MKFWQLVSIAREQPGLLQAVALLRSGWKRYAAFADDFSAIVTGQDREILDDHVDPEFAAAVLSRVTRSLYLGTGSLRSTRRHAEPEISVVEAASRFGSDAVEEALEKGSTSI